jgi:hypothetical protein
VNLADFIGFELSVQFWKNRILTRGPGIGLDRVRLKKGIDLSRTTVVVVGRSRS